MRISAVERKPHGQAKRCLNALGGGFGESPGMGIPNALSKGASRQMAVRCAMAEVVTAKNHQAGNESLGEPMTQEPAYASSGQRFVVGPRSSAGLGWGPGWSRSQEPLCGAVSRLRANGAQEGSRSHD
jgi:hypothetical protein